MKRGFAGFVALVVLVPNVAGVAVAAWPGRNGLIAFSRDDGVYVVNRDGSNSTSVAEGVNPSWSPDGQSLAYSCDGQICTVIPGSGEGGSAITLDLTFRSGQPSWSPNGERIVFARRKLVNIDRNPAELCTIAADGTDERALGIEGNDPAWSPDGERIIFTQGNQGDGIYSVSPSGDDFEELFASGNYLHSPSWAPDGDLIAFTLQHHNYWRVWVMDSDGSNAREIFRGKGRRKMSENRPTVKEVSGRGLSWSPSGRLILYANVMKDAICRIDLEGRRRGCLAAGQYPDWGPLQE